MGQRTQRTVCCKKCAKKEGGLGKDGVFVKVLDVKFKVVAPEDVAVLELTFLKIGRFQVFVVLRVRVLAHESPHIDVLVCAVVEYHVNSQVVVADEAYYHEDFWFHSFLVILVRRILFL